MPSMTYHVPGPVLVEYDSKDLGVSKAGITVRIRTSWKGITDDAHGDEPADFIFAGKSAIVEILTLDKSKLLAAASSLWSATGGFLLKDYSANVGTLASTVGKILKLTERDGSSIWQALLAVVVDPDAITLNATTELQVPVRFLIVPDDVDKLFSTIPSYMG